VAKATTGNRRARATRKPAKKPPAKKAARRTPALAPGLHEQDDMMSVWLGTMPRQALEAYVETSYDEEDDDAPISAFARDLGEHYDADFVESSHVRATTPAKALDGHSYAESFAAAAAAAAAARGLTRVNAVVLMLNQVYVPPRGKKFAKGALSFVGSFPFDPAVD
jgi:hypothetical protein